MIRYPDNITALLQTPMQSISNKSRDTLYDTVAEEVTQARINIEKLNIQDKFIKEQINKIMHSLQCSAPQKALDCFSYQKDW